ncbi:VID27 cytoplasmic protein [Fomitopsis serialis]|uniref:VID27 cytoplasmic protein n=1 Tax=Fomitopsis serialis TaxID=139415 RepID=UPI0020076CEC|nr:VID27 cytoplasmic protein [Neoantrodia serialis]KAH9938170.1 VID27 cytoplasmic protein [Neoantrodia serialis]
MNIFRNLIGRVWHDPNAAEVVKISEGQLYLVRSGTVRGARECIYNDAMATIRRVASVEHNFQLVVTRVYEEGDQELLEDEEETDEERVFLISEELEFRSTTSEEDPCFVWRDLDGDVDEFYEFVAPGTNAPTRAFFETCMYRAMYERKYRKSADDTADADLQEFIRLPPSEKDKGKAIESVAPTEPMPTTASTSATTAPAPTTTAPAPATEDPNAKVLVAHPAELHLWDLDQGFFVKHADVTAKIAQHASTGPFDYWLLVTTDEGPLLAHRVTSDMNQRWALKMLAFTWNYVSDTGSQSSWCLRFETSEAYEQFQMLFSRALWESLNNYSWEKAKAEEQAYVLSSQVQDVEMQDVEDEEEDEEDVAKELDKSDEESDSETETEPEPEEEGGPPPLGKGQRNSQLTVGYKGDRSYVVRGGNIGVFAHTGDNAVKYHATIAHLETPKGKEFAPKHVMLHDQDTKMVLMNPGAPNSLFSLDIERGKITTPQQTIIGASHNALFRIDPRMSGNKMVDSQYKQYVSKNQFSGVATTESGKLAVASEKGDIRLFDSIGKNAKTALPPLGDPIIGVDVTANGRWIVATTKTYLLLIDTLIGEGRYTGQLGFDRSFPANAKPIPRRLQLRAEHVAYMEHSVAFSPARFNMGEGQEENAIVTSTGQYVVAWDFAKVKRGQLDKYEIKKYEDFVVQDNFKFGDDKEIIVALQNDVLAVNKKSLKRPTRASIATPRKSLRSRSNIVNAPY